MAYSFAAQLLQNSLSEQSAPANTLVSPLSLLFALGVLARGAPGQTLEQIETALGLNTHSLTALLQEFLSAQDGDESAKLSIANSIWMRKSRDVQFKESFLKTCAQDLDASILSASFDDSTVTDINTWTASKTDGLIDHLVDSVQGELYLVNALAFDHAWEEPYAADKVSTGAFTREDGSKRDASFMKSREQVYLYTEDFSGFIKPYENYSFSFVGLLPREGLSCADAVWALGRFGLKATLESAMNNTVCDVYLPKFSCDYETDPIGALEALGIKDAFDPAAADFSNMVKDGQSNGLYVSDAVHKTHIEIDENGTKAAAATSFGLVTSATGGDVGEPKVETLVFNRPFIYLITSGAIPVFIGMVTDPTL